jgi:ferredoxin/flavodoxin---NADP+ reductase
MNVVANRQAIADCAPTGTFIIDVLDVEHYTDRLFSFRTTRPASFRFRSGEFVMIGLIVSGKPLYRAYSIASPAWADELEFFSVKVPDGPLTSRLQTIRRGDAILMRQKPTGTLVNDALEAGRRLYMFSTGTGIAPFASLARDPETYEKFDEIILTHTCREVAELRYGVDLVESIRGDEMLRELFDVSRLRHYTTATREPHLRRGRITDLVASGGLFDELGVPPLDPAHDRAMICGSAPMLRDTKELLERAGLTEGSNSRPGQFVIERAFVE